MTTEPKPIKPGHLYVPPETLTLEQYRKLDLKRPLTDPPVGSSTGVKRDQDNAASRVWDEPDEDFTEQIHAALEGFRRRKENEARKNRQRVPAKRDTGHLCVECQRRPKANKKALCAECFNARRRKVPIRIVRNPKEPA